MKEESNEDKTNKVTIHYEKLERLSSFSRSESSNEFLKCKETPYR